MIIICLCIFLYTGNSEVTEEVVLIESTLGSLKRSAIAHVHYGVFMPVHIDFNSGGNLVAAFGFCCCISAREPLVDGCPI